MGCYPISKKCVICGKPFRANYKETQCCSQECRSQLQSIRNHERVANLEHVCPYCGKTYITAYAKKRYCSAECLKAATKAKKREYEQRRKEKETLPPKEEPKKILTLKDEVTKATELGLSYGQYMAKVYRENSRYE